MKMSLMIEGLRSDVAAVGELGDETVAEVAERIAAILARSASSRILDLLSDVAAEVSAELPEGHVEIRLVGDDVQFAYIDERAPTQEPEAELSARITLRLSESLKTRVEEGAGRAGLSVNSFVLRTLERGTSTAPARSGRGGSRLRGYGTS
jgi:predicted DNA binding CopG/RHH family protein